MLRALLTPVPFVCIILQNLACRHQEKSFLPAQGVALRCVWFVLTLCLYFDIYRSTVNIHCELCLRWTDGLRDVKLLVSTCLNHKQMFVSTGKVGFSAALLNLTSIEPLGKK